jgi:cytochrome c biogenesis protein CcdA
LEPGSVVEQEVLISNSTEVSVEIILVSTCSCMTTSDESLILDPGANRSFTIFFDSSDDDGDFEKILIIQTDSPSMPKGFFIVTGSVKTDANYVDESPAEVVVEDEPGRADILYYYTPGCKSCNEFLRKAELPISRLDITEPAYYEELQEELAERGEGMRAVPVMITSDSVFQGEDEVTEGYTALLEGRTVEASEVSTEGGGISIAILPVMAAGLLDGVNPCAFTTLIFLLSALTVAGRSRRETLVIGLFFTVTVFLTYYLIGLGFFKIIRIADSFELVSRIIRWVLFIILIVFAGLSFYDYTKIRAGRAADILLQLPSGVKRRMHDSIRTYTKSAALAGSSIVMGVLISVFELGCTGQIYFPTIAYIIQTDKAASGYLFLALYNLAFILPLAAVFIIVFLGITSKKITKAFQTNLGFIKILTGLLFLCFAVLMLVL